MGLENEFLCHLHCKPCTCYLNLTCHKSNSRKQGGTSSLSTFICVDAGDAALCESDRRRRPHSLRNLRAGPGDPKKQGRRVGTTM